MACSKCYYAQKNIISIGKPVECKCDYCGETFIAGKPSQCLFCTYYISRKDEDGTYYHCTNDEANNEENCSGYEKEEY